MFDPFIMNYSTVAVCIVCISNGVPVTIGLNLVKHKVSMKVSFMCKIHRVA